MPVAAEGRLTLKPGREKSLLRRHPWVFSGAIAGVSGNPPPGATLGVYSAGDDFLAWGAYSPHSQIRARVWSWVQGERIDADFFRRRLQAAFDLRRHLIPADDTDAVRLVHAESDGLPGLIVDRYAEALVAQFLSAGAEAWRQTLTELLAELAQPRWIYERSDAEVRSLEGLPERTGVLWGVATPGPATIQEHGLCYRVDLQGGHKTGFYIDQRANRLAMRAHASQREVLDCFCYTGGFTLNALAGGAAHVEAVDASQEALDLLGANLAANGLDAGKVTPVCGDVFQVLRKRRDQGRSYDLIVLDPPKFAASASQAQRAARGYKDINLLAFKLLRPGGLLATFSCSGGVDADLFGKIVAGAALDAGCEARVVTRFFQAPDHPVSLAFPEGLYLKGLLVCKT